MVKFGTGGWSAVIGDEFKKANIQLLSQGLVNKMKSEGVAEQGIVMGYDRRFLSKEAMQWAAVVFAAAHINVYLINKSSPTPLVMFHVMKHEFPYGMMITASHNPAIYNGIKVFTAGGRDADIVDQGYRRLYRRSEAGRCTGNRIRNGQTGRLYPGNLSFE